VFRCEELHFAQEFTFAGGSDTLRGSDDPGTQMGLEERTGEIRDNDV
jgi:hypothetical protein